MAERTSVEVGHMHQITIGRAHRRCHGERRHPAQHDRAQRDLAQHDTWVAAIRLAAVAGVVAAVAAVLLTTLAGLPAPTVVVAMMVFGFVASWIETGRVSQRHVRVGSVRVGSVRVRRPVG
jgi:hypothetical protein